jgi:hypothetical protein
MLIFGLKTYVENQCGSSLAMHRVGSVLRSPSPLLRVLTKIDWLAYPLFYFFAYQYDTIAK